MSLLFRSEVLGLSGNTLSADNKYSRHYRETFTQRIRMRSLKFSLCFWNLNKFSKILKKKKKNEFHSCKYLRDYWLWKTQLLKCLKGTVLEHPLGGDLLTCRKHCWNLHESTFFSFFFYLFEMNWVRKCLKISQLVRSEVLSLFVNTMTANDKYSRQYKENFVQPIQT